jgi:hypothetical protein
MKKMKSEQAVLPDPCLEEEEEEEEEKKKKYRTVNKAPYISEGSDKLSSLYCFPLTSVCIQTQLCFYREYKELPT